MKWFYLLILIFLGCSNALARNVSQVSQLDFSTSPFLISSGTPLNHPYKGTAYPVGDQIVVVEERWMNDAKLPFEGHLFVSAIKGSQKISGPTKLFQNSDKYFYNPTFVKSKAELYLFFNSFDPITDTASFQRSRFDGQTFAEPESIILNEDLKAQYRPWISVSSADNGKTILTYEWRDPSTKKNRLKLATSQDALNFETGVDMAIGAMARHNFFQEGSQIFTYQNGDPKNMIDFFSQSQDGIKWTPFKPISEQKNLHDVVPFRRLDGDIDLYYIATGTGSDFSIFRRSIDKNGVLGPEQELTKKSDGSVMQPHPTRLADGNVFLVLTKQVTEQTNYDLWGTYVVGDAPKVSVRNNANQCNDPSSKSDYMGSWNCFIQSEKEFIGKPEQTFFDQHMATILSYVGEEKRSRQIFDRLNTSKAPYEDMQLSQFEVQSADAEIINLVANRQILLINEAHHVPETRLLTLQLLKSLYEKGFRYLAAETFNKSALEKTIQRGFPTQETGYYTAEPTYALIVREALGLGYKLIPYEFSPQCDPFTNSPEKCQNLREEGQAKNIYEAIFKNDPQAKVIVHAGYGHIDKKGGENGWSWIPMARYLWELTKIEPFSVDQTFFFEKGKDDLNSGIYANIIEHYRIQKPTILIDKRDKTAFVFSPYQSHYDAQVILPPLKETEGRPSWRKNIPRVKRIQISNLNCPKKSRCLVQAVLSKEKDLNYIPIDQTILRGRTTSLYLQPGNYVIYLIDGESKVITERSMTVR